MDQFFSEINFVLVLGRYGFEMKRLKLKILVLFATLTLIWLWINSFFTVILRFGWKNISVAIKIITDFGQKLLQIFVQNDRFFCETLQITIKSGWKLCSTNQPYLGSDIYFHFLTVSNVLLTASNVLLDLVFSFIIHTLTLCWQLQGQMLFYLE